MLLYILITLIILPGKFDILLLSYTEKSDFNSFLPATFLS